MTNGFGVYRAPQHGELPIHADVYCPYTSAAKRRPPPTATDTVPRHARRQEEKRCTHECVLQQHATPGAKRPSLPITPTRSLETLERVEKKEVSPKTRQNTATSPKAAASSPSSQGTAQRAQHSLKDSAKPIPAIDTARVSSPQDPPSEARETCLRREKRELGLVTAARNLWC